MSAAFQLNPLAAGVRPSHGLPLGCWHDSNSFAKSSPIANSTGNRHTATSPEEAADMPASEAEKPNMPSFGWGPVWTWRLSTCSTTVPARSLPEGCAPSQRWLQCIDVHTEDLGNKNPVHGVKGSPRCLLESPVLSTSPFCSLGKRRPWSPAAQAARHTAGTETAHFPSRSSSCSPAAPPGACRAAKDAGLEEMPLALNSGLLP